KEPIAFVARLTEHDEPHTEYTAKGTTAQNPKAPVAPAATATPSAPAQPAAPGKPEPEIVPTNPKSEQHASVSQSVEPAGLKVKSAAPEKPSESVPTNPKSSSNFAAVLREAASPALAHNTKGSPASDVKETASAQSAELP